MATNNPTYTWLPTRVNDMPFSVVQTFRSLQNWLGRPKFPNGITLGKGTVNPADEVLITSADWVALKARVHTLDGL